MPRLIRGERSSRRRPSRRDRAKINSGVRDLRSDHQSAFFKQRVAKFWGWASVGPAKSSIELVPVGGRLGADPVKTVARHQLSSFAAVASRASVM